MLNLLKQIYCYVAIIALLSIPTDNSIGQAVSYHNCYTLENISRRFIDIETHFTTNTLQRTIIDTIAFAAYYHSYDSLFDVLMKYSEGQQLAMAAFLINDIQNSERESIHYADLVPDFYISIYSKLSSKHNWPYSHKAYTIILNSGGDAYVNNNRVYILYTHKQAINDILEVYEKLLEKSKVCNGIFLILKAKAVTINK